MNDSFPLALPKNTVLAGQYIIIEVIGQGGFGITYKALDRKSGNNVAVKEYFPESMATRIPGQTDVSTYSGDRGDNYLYGKQCFMQEAETLAKFIGNENIVRIYSYFEEYGTAYFVMDFIEGTSLDEYIKHKGGKLEFKEAADILVPVMDALSAVHEKGIVHRDVSPDNIYITKEGIVKLIDFGAARQSLGDKSQSLDIILKHGFAPKEQYTRRGKQGPYTDIYALGATFYYALTGRRPPDALERIDEDEIIPPSTLGVKLSRAAEEAILMALNIQPVERFQTMTAFKNAMMIVKAEDVEKDAVKEEHPEQTESGKAVKPDISRFVIVGAGVIGLACLFLIGFIMMNKNKSDADLADYDSYGESENTEDNEKYNFFDDLQSSEDSLFPEINGNNINNLHDCSWIDSSSAEPGKMYRDPSNNSKAFRCISKIDNIYYALDGNGKPVTFSVIDDRVSNVEGISELSGIEEISSLFVSDEYYFVYSNSQLLSINRKNGSITESHISDLSYDEYTFTEKGRFCYIDWDGKTGCISLYWTPAGDIGSSPETYYTIPDEISGTNRKQIISGGDDIVYVYIWLQRYNDDDTYTYINRLYKFDLSQDKGTEPLIIDVPDDNGHYFIGDGDNLFYYSYLYEKKDLFSQDNKYKLSIGKLNPETGEINELYETNVGEDIHDWSVYPGNRGIFSFFIGNGNVSDRLITVP